jgi:CheY-like chemotaxis protein
MAKVLVADDLPGILQMLVYALSDSHEVSQAANGQEAVSLAEQSGPDIIILDLDMPVMDGIEAAGRIRSNPSLAHTRLIAVTAHRHHERLHRMSELCDALIEKPFRIADIREIVERLSSPQFSAQVPTQSH